MKFTNRVFLPDGKTIYVSDDCAGDDRLVELYQKHGNLRVEVCEKVFGQCLDDMRVIVKTNIKGVWG